MANDQKGREIPAKHRTCPTGTVNGFSVAAGPSVDTTRRGEAVEGVVPAAVEPALVGRGVVGHVHRVEPRGLGGPGRLHHRRARHELVRPVDPIGGEGE